MRKALNTSRRAKILSLACLPFVLFSFLLAGCSGKEAELVWTSIDVNTPTGQGDAHLLTIDGINCVLIDAGPRPAADKLISFIKNKFSVYPDKSSPF